LISSDAAVARGKRKKPRKKKNTNTLILKVGLIQSTGHFIMIQMIPKV
jgi:hypothetical protein